MNILTVGRIAPVKNYEVLIEAARILKSRGVDFSVTIIGAPALEQDKAYEQRIRNESAGLNFHFLGKKAHRELPEIYRSYDIFVHMSQTGSLDKTMLEAMACGMYVVSSNDAAKNILPKMRIFSPHDAQGLADAIQHRHDEGFDARRYVVEHHDLKKLIEKISLLL